MADTEKELTGISEKIAERADTELKTRIKKAIIALEGELLVGDGYHMEVKIPEKSTHGYVLNPKTGFSESRFGIFWLTSKTPRLKLFANRIGPTPSVTS